MTSRTDSALLEGGKVTARPQSATAGVGVPSAGDFGLLGPGRSVCCASGQDYARTASRSGTASAVWLGPSKTRVALSGRRIPRDPLAETIREVLSGGTAEGERLGNARGA